MVEGTHSVLADGLERERLQLAIEAAQLGTWECDLDKAVITVSARAADILGRSGLGALSLDSWRDQLHPDDKDRVYATFMGAAAERAPYREQYRVRLPDGGVRWVAASGVIVGEGDGRAATAIGIIEDITDRKLAEEALIGKSHALAESEAQYRIMGEAIPYGVWLCDANGGARYVSPSFLELLDMTQEEQSEFGWTRRYDPDTVKAMLDRWMHCIRTGELWEYEHRILGPDNEYRTVLSRGRPVRDDDGTITSWVGVNLDITDRKRAETEVARKKAELEIALNQVKELDEAKSRFFANVSHELRTPLALILGPVDDLLANADMPSAWRNDLDVVRRNAQTLLAYVTDLLDLSRLDAGPMRPDYRQSDLADSVRQIAAHFQAAAARRGVALLVDAPERLAAQIDPAKLGRVVFNLMSNAFKHVPDRIGLVEVRLTAAGENAVIEVGDNGPGVPGDMRERIFQRFVQGDEPQRGAGTGLGLAIAKEFVARHGGTVVVGDAPAGGALFRVVIPLTAPEGTPVGPAAGAGLGDLIVVAEGGDAIPTDADPAIPDEDRPLVLVVEDNPDLRAFIAKNLSGVARVAVAEDGADGLAAAERLVPDLVLTDIMMPRMNGDQMVAEMRARAHLAEIPIMVLSARADQPLRTRLLSGQTQDYLVKPFAADELRARVGNLLQAKRARDLLWAEVEGRQENLEELARQVAAVNRTLRLNADEMRVARDRAEQATLAKSAFLNMVSHELRTPLTQLELQLALFERRFRKGLDEREDEIFTDLATAMRRLTRLVGSVLEYSRVAGGRLSVRVERFDPARLVVEACADARDEARRHGLELACAAEGDVPPLVSDPALVRVAIRNLLDNAIKYTPQGRVSARVLAMGWLVRIEVSDTGIGIPSDCQQKVFEPFEHIETVERKHAPGVGLGLALVKEIVTTLGGRVSLVSVPGQGSTFTVELPSMEGMR
ncbi:MAG: PAS domain-containing protein [Alphaproteobacteria bacterium]|nr:PAS domain-containing protein [Alphaproteobacteria bacterium]